jgi:uncharacterized protein (DUF433 family)
MMARQVDNLIQAFSEEHVERLTGISKAQLRYWDRTGFFVPAFADENRRAPFSRIYSFKDVASLRVLSVLRNQYDVPLQHLRKVAEKLSDLADDKGTRTTLWVWKKKVIFQEPGTDLPREVVDGQFLMDLPLKSVVEATERDARHLLARSPDQVGKISKSRNVSRNLPVVAGTRIPVRAIQHFAEDGCTVDQILAEYPSLSREDVEAALNYGKAGKAA